MRIEHTLPPAKDPGALALSVGRALDRAAQETAREMRRTVAANRSTAFSNLLNSIQVFRDSEFERSIAPTVNHARMVDEGTGPAAGKARYFPDPRALEPYVKLRAGVTYSGRPGSASRWKQRNEVRDRAWALARFIFAHGTQPHPFAAPTAENMRPRILELLAGGVREGLEGGRA